MLSYAHTRGYVYEGTHILLSLHTLHICTLGAHVSLQTHHFVLNCSQWEDLSTEIIYSTTAKRMFKIPQHRQLLWGARQNVERW